MKPFINDRSTTVGGVKSTTTFGISFADEAHIMGILRDQLYSDKVLAVLREYASNAWDAHRSVGKGSTPIRVMIPTHQESVLRIRDFGPGLSHEAVAKVYTQYGASTKRDSDEVVGMLGIGSKSGFAYSDNFTVTSWHDGVKRVYSMILDESEKGLCNLLDEQELLGPTLDWDETGVEIELAIRREDIYEVKNTASKLFQYFTPRPAINITLPDAPSELTTLVNGSIAAKPQYDDASWIAIMGCVPYRVNLSQLNQAEISKCLPKLSGSLFFNIGEVQVSASREELKYSTHTKAKLVEKLNALVDEYVLHALANLENTAVTDWEKRLQVQVLHQLDLPLPEEWTEWAETEVKLTYAPGTFHVLHAGAVTTRIMVTGRTRLLIDDAGKPLTGYTLGLHDYVVRGHDGAAGLRTLLDAAIAESGLTGITVALLSTLNWAAPYVKPKKVINLKHRAKMFVLDQTSAKFKPPYSTHWTVETRIPQAEDVFIVVKAFKPEDISKIPGNEDFYDNFRVDRQLAKALGETLPPVYGYKSTDKAPVDPSTVTGTHYSVWREAWVKSLLTPERITRIDEYFWGNPSGDRYLLRPDLANRKRLIAQLGTDHPLVELVEKSVKFKAQNDDDTPIFNLAYRNGIKRKDSDAFKALAAMHARYPLLKSSKLSALWHVDYDEDATVLDEWLDYVKLVDERRPLVTPNNIVQLVSVP